MDVYITNQQKLGSPNIDHVITPLGYQDRE